MSFQSPQSSPLTEAFAVLDFWFNHVGPDEWFKGDPALDQAITEHFIDLHGRAAAGELDGWAETSSGALALILVLDQFSRHLYRGKKEAFAQDAKARQIARRMLESGLHFSLGERERAFLFLPFEHSEDARDQTLSVDLFTRLGNPDYLDWAERHKAVIDRFGRFPHRNAALGRESTPEEEAFLAEKGAGAPL